MPRQPVDNKTLANIFGSLHNQGIAEIHMKGFTEEQESREMRTTFEEVHKKYPNIHTLKIIPADGREPCFVHVDGAYRK